MSARVFGRNSTVTGIFDESSVCHDVLANMTTQTSLMMAHVQFHATNTRTRGPHGHRLVRTATVQSSSRPYDHCADFTSSAQPSTGAHHGPRKDQIPRPINHSVDRCFGLYSPSHHVTYVYARDSSRARSLDFSFHRFRFRR